MLSHLISRGDKPSHSDVWQRFLHTLKPPQFLAQRSFFNQSRLQVLSVARFVLQPHETVQLGNFPSNKMTITLWPPTGANSNDPPALGLVTLATTIAPQNLPWQPLHKVPSHHDGFQSPSPSPGDCLWSQEVRRGGQRKRGGELCGPGVRS